jgi:hypothetical protein
MQHNNSAQFLFINVLNEHPNPQAEEQHNLQTQIWKDNKQGTWNKDREMIIYK